LLYTKLVCGVCGSNLLLDDDIYICPECGFETDAEPIRYDAYWTKEDERRANEELDTFFFTKYPQFRKK